MKSSKNSKLRCQMQQLQQQQQQQLLSKETQKTLQKYEHAVICLMILIAITSIIWSASVYNLTTDLTHGIVGAKIIFSPRDFTQLDEKTKEVFYDDLVLLNKSYTEAALEIKKSKDAQALMAKEKEKEMYDDYDDDEEDGDDDKSKQSNATEVNFELLKDQQFLAKMTIDVHQTRWRRSIAVQFIYSFPFLSEIISIVWATMCLVFLTNGNKYWGLPQPWRIVVPSILTFALMSLSTTVYTLLANKYVNNFCTELKAPLYRPNVLSCGQAVSVLRHDILPHKLSHDVYLVLFRISYTLTLTLWLLALLIVSLRFALAIDFRCVEMPAGEKRHVKAVTRTCRDQDLSEQLLNFPTENCCPNLPTSETHKSEDDFQSAKSYHSDVGSPLLTNTLQQPQLKASLSTP